ncbi:MAG: NosD domain-containing protein, partial [Candidatus Hodarchaeales archaeon]
SSSSNVSSNTVLKNYKGIEIRNSDNILIHRNTVYNNVKTGIRIDNSNKCILSENSISFQESEGIIVLASFMNNISYNSISYNDGYGISFGYRSSNNLIFINDFVRNNPTGRSQAIDDGSFNIFENNFWDDWDSPDENRDGIVDDPYLLDGLAKNRDAYPRASQTGVTWIGINTFFSIIFLGLILYLIFILLRKQKR